MHPKAEHSGARAAEPRMHQQNACCNDVAGSQRCKEGWHESCASKVLAKRPLGEVLRSRR